MNWHQQAAARRAYQLRNYKAHICADNYVQTGKALCGATSFPVYVDRQHAHNPANNVCKRCLAKLSVSTIGE